MTVVSSSESTAAFALSSSPSSPESMASSLHISDTPHAYKKDIIGARKPITENIQTMHKALFDIMDTIQNLPDPKIHYSQVKAQCLYLQREFIFLASQQEEMTKDELTKYKEMVELLNRINIYVTGKDSDVLNSHLKILTFITAVLTPAGVLVGYFGMNFSDMGSPSNGMGVFSLKHGHFIVFGILIAIVLFMTYMYYYVLS